MKMFCSHESKALKASVFCWNHCYIKNNNMKVIKTLFLLSAFSILAASTLQAARIYVVYDPECMDRLEYNYFKDGNTGVYVAYHVRLSASERLVLEIGREDGIEQDRLPAGVVNCSNGLFDRQTMKRINNKSDELIIVYPTLNRRYIMMPVRIAALHQWNGQVISYNSPTYSFRFDTKEGAVGENISYNNPNVQVYFEGRMANDCSGAYIFRQYTNATGVANAYSEIVIAPEVGITEARSGLTPEDATNNVVVLERVNNRVFADHLLLACGKAPVSSSTANVDKTPVPGNDYTGSKGSGAQTKTSGATVATMHTVQPGETLYGIAKKYGVTVKQVQTWNKMGQSTSIRKGAQLQVGETSAETPASFESAGSNITTGKGMGSGSGGGSQAAKTTTGTYHIVKTGETIGYLAQKYGYTEKRFREFNNLGENDWIKVGQRLKTTDCECPQSTGLKSYESSGERFSPKGTIQPATNSSQVQEAGRSSAYYNYNYNQPSQQAQNSEAEIRPSAYSIYDSPIVMPAPQQQSNQSGMQYYDDAPLPITTEASTVPQTVRNSNPQNDFNDRTTPLIYDAQADYQTKSAPAATTNYANNGSLPQNYESGVSKNYHVVQSGENLYRIAKQYGLTMEYLRRINNMNTDDVFPNQRIALR